MSSYVEQALPQPNEAAEGSGRVQEYSPVGQLHILYHGSCRRCHHLHTACPVEVREDEFHQRILCTNCEHPLFGLGRNSTQTTLASVLTSSTWKHETNPSFEVPPGCLNAEVAEHGLSCSYSGQGILDEVAPPHRSTLHTPRSNNEDTPEPKLHEKGASRKPTFLGSIQPDATSQDSKHRSQRRKSSKLKERVLRLLHSFRRPSPLRKGPRSPTRPPGSLLNTALPTQNTASRVETQSVEGGPRASLHGVFAADSFPPADFTDNDQDNDTVPKLRKRHRLHVLRREKTLKKRFLRRRRCCTPNCVCNTGNSASQARHTSPIDSNQPQPPAESRSEHASVISSGNRPSTPCPVIERIRRTTEYLGTHLPEIPYRVPSSGREDSIQLEYARSSQSSASGSVSQATTAVEGRSATSGLHHRESSLFRRRSNRSPALLPDVRSRFLTAPRAEVVESMRRVDELGLSLARRSTDQTDRSLASHRRQSTRQSSSSESAGGVNNSSSSASGSGSRANTASLSRLTTMIGELDASGGNDPSGEPADAGRPTPITEEPTPSNPTDEEQLSTSGNPRIEDAHAA